MSRDSSVEAKVRMATEDAVKKMQSMEPVCVCSNRMAKGCRNCALRHVAERLREAGYNSALCKSKWSRSLDIPSGNWEYFPLYDLDHEMRRILYHSRSYPLYKQIGEIFNMPGFGSDRAFNRKKKT